MGDLGERLAEQWRLMRQAPIPYAAALLVLAGLIFAAFQWGYGRILDLKDVQISSKDIQISSLEKQVSDLTAERDKLKASPPPVAAQPPSRDPDGLYQSGELSAHAEGAVLDRNHSVATFQAIRGGASFDIAAPMEYRQFLLTGCTAPVSSSMSGLSMQTTVGFAGVTCHIAGAHP